MIEWMTQQHYLGSIRDDGDLDPLFKSLLKHHWMEEAQHAKLDTLIVDALAEGRSEEQIDKAIDEFFEIGSLPRRRTEDAGRLQPRRAREERSAARSRTAMRSSPSSTRPRAGPTSAPAWSTSASRTRSSPSRRAPLSASPKRRPIFA